MNLNRARWVALAAVSVLAACGGGGGGGAASSSCTPAQVVNLSYKDARIDPASPTWPTSGIYFASLDKVIFNPVVGETCGAARTFRVSGGVLPPGLALDRNTGVLSGTPTTMGLKSFALGLTVAGYSGEATRPLSFEIDDFSFAYATNTALVTTATVVSLTPALNDGVSNTSGQTGSLGLLGRHNGTRGSLIPTGATTTYSILTGAMPPGVSLNAATGVISGTPMATGVFDFKVKLTVTFEGASVDAVDSPGQTMRITVS